jgi:tetratricopeptide (TPR) repeat protein
MGDRFQAWAQSLTGNNSLEECSIESLRQITNRHPYFAPAQFLLLQKLRASGNEEEAAAQYRRAVLYYHDPLLFEQFMAAGDFTETAQLFSHAEGEGEQEVAAPEEATSPQQPGHQPGTEIQPDILTPELSQQDEIREPAPPVYEEQDFTQETTPPTQMTPTGAGEWSVAAADVDTEGTDTRNTIEEIRVPVESERQVAPAASAEEEVAATPGEGPVPTNRPLGDELTFEPFHTVDYFASQGIKISGDELPKDKLGKQLKSFTEWLKTMKRLPAAAPLHDTESPAEKKVETLASRSVSESDVLTEAMAEVWLKQGATAKALDIYNKLSLLNPSKKAYFAAKIENLKPS